MNERKIEILTLLSDGSWTTSPDVAGELGLTLSNASELLRRYHKDGLVVRQAVPGPGPPPRLFAYNMTTKGFERLEWLIENQWEVTYER